jgi:hypothetical protein
MRVPAARREFAALEARLAAASDLLNVAKALSVQVATRSLRHRWSDGQLPADLAPQNAPQREKAHRFCVREYAPDLGGAKRARTADLLHAMNHRHAHRRRHTLRQLRKH